MKYDDASWHYNGDFPRELSEPAGATHIGMFVAWCVLNGMAGVLHVHEFPDGLAALQERRSTPGQFILDACDEKFTDEDLNDEGNAFARAYYTASDDSGISAYLTDYEAVLGQTVPTLYHVEDSWGNFETIAPVIERRFREWRAGTPFSTVNAVLNSGNSSSSRPWWKFW
jgi:hypothetical protein